MRYFSADSYQGDIANSASLNRYSYVHSNPYKYTDPSGHCPWCVAGAIIGGVVGAGGGVWYAIDHRYSWRSGKFWASVGIGAGSGALVGGTMGLAGTALAGGGGAAAAGTALTAEGAAAPGVIQEMEAAAPEVEAAGADAVSTWGNGSTLTDHFVRHGADVGASTEGEYATAASDFLVRSQAEKLPTKIDSSGIIRVYDAAKNLFGAYNADGTTRTLFSPSSGAQYFDKQPGSLVGGQ